MLAAATQWPADGMPGTIGQEEISGEMTARCSRARQAQPDPASERIALSRQQQL
jgi:hypothetical protein